MGANFRKIASNRAQRVSGNDKIKLSTSSLESSQKYPEVKNFNPEQCLEISSDGMSDSQPAGVRISKQASGVRSNAGRRRPTEDYGELAWQNERGGLVDQNDVDLTNDLDQTEDELVYNQGDMGLARK